MRYKFGCRPSRPKDIVRNIQLADVIKSPAELPPLQGSCDWTQKVKAATPWLMLGNGPDDAVATGFQGAGDCVLVAAEHLEMVHAFNIGQSYVPNAARVVSEYSCLTGFDASKTDGDGNNPTDTGLDPASFLKYWRDTGIGDPVAKKKIGAWVMLNPRRWIEYQYAVQCLEGVMLSLALPLGIDYENDKVWDIPLNADLTDDLWTPGVAGHHMVMSAHSDKGIPFLELSRPGLHAVTWGMERFLTQRFLSICCQEPYAVISQDMLDDKGKCPTGFDSDGLQRALDAVAKT